MGKEILDEKTLGENIHDTFHPGNGKLQSLDIEEDLDIAPTPPDELNGYDGLSEKYTAGEDELPEHFPLRHKNRNALQGGESYKGREHKPVKNNRDNKQPFTEDLDAAVAEELPGVLTKNLFTELANYKADCCISLFISTQQPGVAVNDANGFKKLLQDLARQLGEKGHDQVAVTKWLKPGYDLILDESFWLNLSPGLAVFISEGFFKYIKIPTETQQKTVIESTFYVTPLVPMMQRSERFYLLAISKQSAKLFLADAYGMQHVPMDLPQSIEEIKPSSDLEGTTHGANVGKPEDKDKIATYFEAVDDILFKELLNKENAPLVLAGVEYLIPIYRSCCDYHNVWKQALTGNRDRQETSELYAEAKQLMQPYFDQAMNKALELYGNRSGGALTTSIPADVIPAAYYGRVSHLFVCKGEHIWGTFDELTSELDFHSTPGEKSEELVDNAVVKTLANGGEVFVLEKEQMPADSCIAALMRY